MILALTVLSALATSPALSQGAEPADDRVLDVRVREWYARTGGSIEADTATPGSRVSLSADLDLGEREPITELELVGHVPSFGRLYASWWRESSDADQTLTRTISFRGRSFTSGTPLHSSLVLDVIGLSYEYPFPRISLGDFGRLELSLQAGLRGFLAEGSIHSSGQEASARGFAVTPVLGGHVAYLIRPWVRIDADASGFQIAVSSEKFSYVETKAEVAFRPLRWLYAGIGYKYVYIRDRYSATATTVFDADVGGGYLMVGVSF
jgi:hypothetical protein